MPDLASQGLARADESETRAFVDWADGRPGCNAEGMATHARAPHKSRVINPNN